jgi:DNA polymerase sigma
LSSPLTEKSLGSILLAFLEYYADGFPYETAVISVRTGMLLTKEQKVWYASDPQERDLLSIECMVDPSE